MAKYKAIPAYVFADAAMRERKYGLIRADGNCLLAPVFDHVEVPVDDYVKVAINDDEEKLYGVIQILGQPSGYFEDKVVPVDDMETNKNITENINEKEKTADLYRKTSIEKDIFIPRSIYYQSKEYLIVEICNEAFKYNNFIESITFEKNSELISIGKKAFENSSIENISISHHITKIDNYAFYLASTFGDSFIRGDSNAFILINHASLESVLISNALLE